MTKDTIDLFTSINNAYTAMIAQPNSLNLFEAYDSLVDNAVEKTDGKAPAELTDPMTYNTLKCDKTGVMSYNQMAEIQGQMAFGN